MGSPAKGPPGCPGQGAPLPPQETGLPPSRLCGCLVLGRRVVSGRAGQSCGCQGPPFELNGGIYGLEGVAGTLWAREPAAAFPEEDGPGCCRHACLGHTRRPLGSPASWVPGRNGGRSRQPVLLHRLRRCKRRWLPVGFRPRFGVLPKGHRPGTAGGMLARLGPGPALSGGPPAGGLLWSWDRPAASVSGWPPRAAAVRTCGSSR